MYSSKHKHLNGERLKKSKKDKKLSSLINNSDSDTGEESEHELSYYIGDRVKLMKEVLKIVKPRKIFAMAPDCMRNMDKDEINSMLLEELLGISNKRLKYIFEGKNLDEESSTDEDQPVDVISLDDISDDDFVIISDEEGQINKSEKRKKIKEELKEKSRKVKKEKLDKIDANNKNKVKSKNKNVSAEKEPVGEENLMSVLELLELQARARAIRSQLELENRKKKEHKDISEPAQNIEDEDDDEIIIEVPKEEEIVIPSSDSENEKNDDYSSQSNSKHNVQELDNRPREIENTEELLVESASSEPKNLKDVIDINAGKDDSQEEIMAVSSESNIPSDNTKLIKDGEDMPTSSNGDTQVIKLFKMLTTHFTLFF